MIAAIFFSIFFLFCDAGVLFLTQPSFGRLPQGKRLERIKQSPHYDGKKFVNEIETEFTTGKKSKLQVWKDFMLGDKTLLAPDTALHAIKTDLKKLPQDRDWIVWFGHSSYLLNLSGKKVLVDPVFYKGSPVKFANKMFLGTDIYKPADMPDIDYLVISHDHWDHLDYEVVKEMEPRIKKVVAPLGVGEHFEYWGYSAEKLVELDWWQSEDFGEGYRVTATPARHFSGRGLQENRTFWASFAFKSPKRLVWIGGDSPDWAHVHTLPKYLGKEMTELGAKRYLTVHHSKFCLSKHKYFEPLENAKRAAKESGKPVLMPEIGEVMYLD